MDIDKDSADIIRAFTHSLLNAFYYIRSNDHMCALCSEVKRRLSNENCVWSDDGNIIYSALVSAFGDYGTSPRGGWFPDGIVSIIIDEINEFIDLSSNTEG